MTSLFSPPKMPEPTPMPVVPTRDDQAVKDAEERQRKAALMAKGRQSTILTGGMGLQEEAPVKKKQLFGE